MTEVPPGERLLGLPIFRENVTEDGAGLALVLQGNLDELSPIPGQLILQQSKKDSHSPGEDRPVQPGFLPDHPTRALPGPRAERDMFRIGVLDTDDRLGFDDRRRGLAKKTQPHVREFRVRSRHPSLLFPEVPSGFRPGSSPISS